MISIGSIEAHPFHEIPFLFVPPCGGVVAGQSPIFRAKVRGIPESLSALILLSDLQSVSQYGAENSDKKLIGFTIAEV